MAGEYGSGCSAITPKRASRRTDLHGAGRGMSGRLWAQEEDSTKVEALSESPTQVLLLRLGRNVRDKDSASLFHRRVMVPRYVYR